ncbi:ATP-dependent RNA helicase HrpA [Oleiharenicola lentus]|uniref:ATP-dependent RNA helicase HrpA n=1 Tax=Oleiharenicola lentus TaxID=2508720 RepID=UPI003F66C00D
MSSSRRHKPWPFRIEYPPELPISARAEEIVTAIRDNQVLVLAGETGSGKTTQIPKMCLAAGRGDLGRIACTQPRRVAASSVAKRVAEELNVPLGREVGCKIRFADQTSEATVIKFMTDGMLLAELQGDPTLREYDTVIVDEAHERSLNIDFIIGHLRKLRLQRPELKIVITSATIDTEAFSKAFDGAPIIEVSGRVYPVEVIYAPLEELNESGDADSSPESERKLTSRDQRKNRSDEFTYLDAAVEAVERVLLESSQGDVLVFMPTERDIREATDLLVGRRLGRLDIVPLFGRLTNVEQQRVFAPSQLRKIVIATNIAETSLTIPGIRFVIDTGLARLSRYVPQSRTRRLPVEPVSQSSADQRKGRCGRVSDGVCIRLYSEQDYLDRPRFTQPEIQRSNLADVILRMKAFGLGDIEEFPFLNAPPAKGIRAGYGLLHELGAIDDAGVLTDLGRELAHLPVDPTVGRMILQARTEKALREVLIIASGLSIQDPRERPLDQKEKADTAHKKFTHPDSDFLALLAIWDDFHGEFETMTLGKLRKFCTAHFLSFMRMREWRDVHQQLEDSLRERDGFKRTSVFDGVKPGAEIDIALGTPAYRSIHRSILAGTLGNIATRTDEGDYKAAHDRRVVVFPGSALADNKRREQQSPKSNPTGGRVPPAKAAKWIMAAEVMETTRLYARTAARIDPQWLLDLAEHLIRVSHSEPFWSAENGRVLVKERRRLYNLELETRSVGFGKINPKLATEIFIREGLVGDTITWPLDFIAHNRRMREEAESRLTRTRNAGYMNLDEAVYRFYSERIWAEKDSAARPEVGPYLGVSSVAELVDFVRHQQMTNRKFLFLSEDDLRSSDAEEPDAEAFPEALPVSNQVLPLAYAYQPGKENDGVTVRVSIAEAEALTPAALDWAVPGHLAEKVELMLKALPKELRRLLIPLTETAQKLTRDLALISARPKQPTLAEALAELLSPRLGVRIDPVLWSEKSLPDHLRVRVEVVDNKERVVGSSRDLVEIQHQLHTKQRDVSKQAATVDNSAWRAAREKWEGEPAGEWKFGDLPEEIVVSEHHGVPVLSYPALRAMEAGVAVRLYATPEEAAAVTRVGLAKLFETQLRYELGWLEKDLKALRMIGTLYVTLTTSEALQKDALAMIVRWLCGREVKPLHEAVFAKRLAEAKQDLRGVVMKLTDWLKEAFALRLTIQTTKAGYPGMADDLAALMTPDFLRHMPLERVKHLPRYLKGMLARAERFKRDAAKDTQRAAELAPFVTAARKLGDKAMEFRWLVEEFRVSLFAQELGTAEPVSAVRLERALTDVNFAKPKVSAPTAGAAASIAPVTAGKKAAPIKSLSSLDQLFRK